MTELDEKPLEGRNIATLTKVELFTEVARLLGENDKLRDLTAHLRLQSQTHAMEARSANSTINEIYQVISGGKGERGSWQGAEPVRRYVNIVRRTENLLRDQLEWYGEQARLARLIHSEGDKGRNALAEDGGKRARSALSAQVQDNAEPPICATTSAAEDISLTQQVQDVAGWQPIEAAQRDGTRLLLMWEPFSGMSEHVELGKWNARNGWVNTYGHAFSGTPTHWMPLPAAPAKQEGGTNE